MTTTHAVSPDDVHREVHSFPADDLGPTVFQVSADVELLNDVNRGIGWHAEYRQLEAGRPRLAAAVRSVGSSSVLRESSDRRLELTAEAPEGMISVVATRGELGPTFNGHRLDDAEFGLFSPGSDLFAAIRGPTAGFSLQIPQSLFHGHLRSLRPDHRAPKSGSFSIGRSPSPSDDLWPLLCRAMSAPAEGAAAPEFEAELVATVIRGLPEHEACTRSRGSAGATHHQVLQRAREYIETHLDHPLPMVDVCTAAGTSRSTLERAFRRELQLTPVSYIRARRLNAVRKELKQACREGLTVSRIATNFGFTHLGRFSGYYRQHFGELPSDTLASLGR